MAERPVVQTPLDRYVVLEYLAEGGMGAIYLGKKLGAGGFEKEVVLKQLLPEFTVQPEFIDLFLREARLTATLDHANIVHTIDLVNAGDEYFIVMEYVRGGDLRTLLKRAKRRKKRVPPQAAMFIAREILSGLSYAHQKIGLDGKPLGIIHRDVSPSNILVSGTGEVKLTDFGIAKASTHRSIFYRVKGKVGYMSPEQAKNEQLDPRSDLYSVAVCLYEMLTGERLFVAAGLTTSAEDIYKQPIVAVSKKRPDLPKDLDKVMFKALAVNRDERYQSAGQFQEALLRCAHRNNLMCTATEAGTHLLEACGKVADWHSTTVVPEPSTKGGVVADFVNEPGTDRLRLADVAFDAEGTGEARGATGTAILPEGASDEEADDADQYDSDIDSYLEEEAVSDLDAEWAREARGRSQEGTGAQTLFPRDGGGTNVGPGGSPRARPTGTGTGVRRRRASESGDAGRLAGIELTSIIQLAELTHAGAKPLVDLSTGPNPSQRGTGRTTIPPPVLPAPAPSAPASKPAPPPAARAPAPASARPAPEPPAARPAPSRSAPPPVSAAPAPAPAPVPAKAAPGKAAAKAPARAPQRGEPPVLSSPSTPSPAAGKRPSGAQRPSSAGPIPTARVRTLPERDPWARRVPAWLPVTLLVLIGVGIAYAIAMSGPELATPTPAASTRLAPPPPPPPPASKSRLTVESEPSGAKVTVDGQDRGCTTPCTLDDLSPTSPLLLRLDKKGFQPWSGLHNPGADARRSAKLRTAPADASRLGALTVRGNVPAEVLVDGVEIGHVTTGGPIALVPGTHEITLVAASGSRAQLKVTLKAGEVVEKSVELK